MTTAAEYHTVQFFIILTRFDDLFFQAEDGIRDLTVTGVQTCALPILSDSMRLLADYLRYLDKANEVTLFVLDPDLRFDNEFPAEARRVVLPKGGHYFRAPA